MGDISNYRPLDKRDATMATFTPEEAAALWSKEAVEERDRKNALESWE